MSADVSLSIGDRGFAWFALAFALTQLVEVPIYTAALRAARPGAPARRRRVRIAIAFGASALTHPLVWYLFPLVATSLLTFLASRHLVFSPGARTMFYGALAEGFAILAEAAYLRAFGARRPLSWSFAANTASVLVGTATVHLLS